MPVVSYTTIGGGLLDKDRALMRRYYGLELSLTARKRTFFRRGELKELPGLSFLPAIGEAWGLLSVEDQTAWTAAGAIVNLTGYNLFCQDKAYRIKNDLAGNAVPSLFHQYLVGHLNIPEGAGACGFRQENKAIFTFPASLVLSAKTALTADPANGEFVKVNFTYEFDEGGGLQYDLTEIELPLAAVWADYSEVITEHSGLTGNWVLQIDTFAVKGDFYFDNLYVSTAGGIITKDPHCEKVEKRWLLELYPAGVVFESLYPAGGAL